MVKKRGDRVWIISGKWKDFEAWFDKDKPKEGTDSSYYLILKDEDDDSLFRKTIRKSVVSTENPSHCRTRLDAAVYQIPQVEKSMKALCNALAKCRVAADEETLVAFGIYLATAKELHDAKGKKATYFDLDYDDKRMTI